MQISDISRSDPGGGLPLMMAADLQDQLMMVTNDLERLQRLLDDASETLSVRFYGATHHINHVLRLEAAQPLPDGGGMHAAMQDLAAAITALQFHDMATQLITHTHKRLRGCADRIANEAMGDDEDGAAVIEELPLRPNPVTQDEMDAGSVELF